MKLTAATLFALSALVLSAQPLYAADGNYQGIIQGLSVTDSGHIRLFVYPSPRRVRSGSSSTSAPFNCAYDQVWLQNGNQGNRPLMARELQAALASDAAVDLRMHDVIATTPFCSVYGVFRARPNTGVWYIPWTVTPNENPLFAPPTTRLQPPALDLHSPPPWEQ